MMELSDGAQLANDLLGAIENYDFEQAIELIDKVREILPRL